jgi:DNA (cytosine-5)-methyltransferase 1
VTRAVVDLFAGPGGWDIAAAEFRLEPLGIEFDDAACATRNVAGLRTIQADVSSLDPQEFAPVWGLIASPPCQAFSMAGGGHGRRALAAYEEAIERWLEGKPPSREELDEACEDERGHLVLEPLRWALALHPTWIALEQVEPVLPLWEAMAKGFRRAGYSTWTGVLSSEQYGVPQTRKRAILLARRDGKEARRPPPTHQRYVAPRRKEAQEESLFDAPEPKRIVYSGEEGLLPWVSMADALGWAPLDESGFPRLNDVEGGEGEYRERDLRPATEPAFALTEKARSWTRFRANAQGNATERSVDEPAPTITGGHDHGERRWLRAGTGEHEASRASDEPAPTLRFGARLNDVSWTSYNSRDQKDGHTGKANRQRSVDEPAPTIAVESRNDSWNLDVGGSERGGNRPRAASEPAPTVTASAAQVPARWVPDDSRPSTTVNGDPRISEPGHHDSDVSGSQQANAVRVSVEEAAVLQSFPPNYPWQGTRSKVFEQIGNAIPPLLALAILREVCQS